MYSFYLCKDNDYMFICLLNNEILINNNFLTVKLNLKQ